jgi:drug/metabolite transporter (DMT)-like permease
MTSLSAAAAAAALTVGAPRAAIDPKLFRGLLVGLVAASIGALYTVFARWGIARGMDSTDMTFLRFGVAGVVTLPVLALALRRDARAFFARWRAWLAVSLLAGPLFGLLMFTALQWAPASHAAVFPFTAMSVMGTLMSVAFLGDRLTLRKVLGIAIVVTGLVILSGLDLRSLSGRALLGDALFIAAGTLWAGFGIVMRKQRLDPLLATAVISFAALVTYVPAYLGTTGLARLLATAPSVVWAELLVQGLVAGAGTLYTYSKMVALLGPARAAVFPALAPGIAALLAWPLLGHVPSGIEAAGLTISVLGLLITVTAGMKATGP